MSKDIESLRKNYIQHDLSENNVEKDPLKQFDRWFQEAIQAQVIMPNAMALSTSTREGAPSLRMVLMKNFDKNGFSFYTNYESRKGKELKQNPRAALLFYWAELERQIRIEGNLVKVSCEESIEYFHTRPREHQLSAWASHQSEPLRNRQELDDRFERCTNQFAKQEIPLPEYWGGYRLTPIRFEFWQGRPKRLHDRIQYTLENAHWKILRLAP